MQKIDAIILAGGLGTRLRSVVSGMPKPMAPVCGRPFLDILLNKLSCSGIIRSVVLALSYRSDDIVGWYSKQCDKYSFPISYSIENKPLGTGGGVRQALEFAAGQVVLVMNGDSFLDIDYGQFFDFHIENLSEFTMALKFVEDVSRYGTVEINEANNQVLSFREKAYSTGGGYINTGVYLFDKSVLLKLRPKTKLSLECDLLPNCVGDNCFGYLSEGDFIDIGTPETYGIVDKFMRGKL